MIAIVSCLAGVLGMLTLWCWAWRLWQRATKEPGQETRLPRLIWHGELLPPRRRPTPPPSWLFEADAAPLARTHATSSTDTSLFAREEGVSCEERTEVLSEAEMLDPGETQSSLGGRTCRLGTPTQATSSSGVD